jgi:hypothetical protein
MMLMKTKKFFFILALLCLLALFIQTNTAIAQDDGPPTETDEVVPDQFDPPDPGFKFNINTQVPDNDRSLAPVTDLLIIDSDVNYEDAVPKVAFGYTEYGVAYEKNGNIYVTFVKYDGTILNTYLISTHEGENGYPDIAFEGSSGLFVVAWESYYSSTDIDVLCRAVDLHDGPIGEGSNYVSGNTDADEYNPSLDCNHDDGSCLVVFTYYQDPNTYFYGRFMQINSVDGVHTPYHPPFPVTTTSGGSAISFISDPMVAWGWNAEAYIVVGTANMDDPYDDFGFYSLVHETYQSTGDQYMTSAGTHYLVDPWISDEEDWEWLDNDIVPTDVTYDPCTKKFLVLFTHDWYDDASDFDILLQMVDGVPTMTRVGFPIEIAFTMESETSGAISFLTNAWYASQWDIGPDRVAISYHLGGDNGGIMTTIIEGNCSTSTPYYPHSFFSDHILVQPPSQFMFADVDKPAVTGSDGEGKYLIVFKEKYHAFNPVQDVRGYIYLAQDEYTLSVDVNPNGKGSVIINPDQATYHKGDKVTLTANGVSGWSFSSWGGDASGTDNPLTIEIQGDTSITVNFAQNVIIIHNYLPVIWK